MNTIKPLNIWSRSDDEIGRLMSHFAHTPFTLDGVDFGSVEAFYTWLLCSETRREKVAPMWGARSKRECPKVRPEYFDYHGRTVKFRSPEHRELIIECEPCQARSASRDRFSVRRHAAAPDFA